MSGENGGCGEGMRPVIGFVTIVWQGEGLVVVESRKGTHGTGASSDIARAFLRFASAIRSSSLLRLVITERSSRMVWNSSCSRSRQQLSNSQTLPSYRAQPLF